MPFFLIHSHLKFIRHSKVLCITLRYPSNPIQSTQSLRCYIHLLDLAFFSSKVGLKIREANNGVGGKRLVCLFFTTIRLSIKPLSCIAGHLWHCKPNCSGERETCPEPAAMVQINTLLHWYIGTSTHFSNFASLTIDVISGMPTAPSLTGLKCRRQKEITKRWKNHYISTLCSVVILTLWSYYSWSHLNSHARWCSWDATTWQCRLCWTSSPPRTWCRRPPGSSTASPQSCLILGWEKTICRGWFEICFRNTTPSLETTWKLTTFLEDYFLRRLPP